LSHIPARRQTLFFSATLAPKMEALAHSMVRNPVRVSITPDEPAVERIAQKVLFVGKGDKDALLVSLLDDRKVNKVLIFTQMKYAANRVVKKLSTAGIDGAAIHGNKSQAARTRALDGFKQGEFRVLVATDVAARGLDVDDITHVINYDLPLEAETYVHRIGRTARAGAGGDAISFCCAEDRANLRDIERLLGQPVPAEMEHTWHSDEAFHSVQPAQNGFSNRVRQSGPSGGRPGGRTSDRPSGRPGGGSSNRPGRRPGGGPGGYAQGRASSRRRRRN
jgi:ATP-dependent RNA helicase RhlE